MPKTPKNKKGFTLIELLIVIAIIGILAAITLVVMNHNRHLASSRNTRRKLDVHTISIAVIQNTVDTGFIPSVITTTETEICRKNAASCSGLVDLSILTLNSKYLISIPIDPKTTSTDSAGYTIYRTAFGRVVINAPLAENSEIISVER